VYGEVPPEAVTVAVPSLAPKADAAVAVADADTAAAGWVTVNVREAVHELASVTVTVYVPASNPVLVADVPPPVQL
jgi:hypothetical protein